MPGVDPTKIGVSVDGGDWNSASGTDLGAQSIGTHTVGVTNDTRGLPEGTTRPPAIAVPSENVLRIILTVTPGNWGTLRPTIAKKVVNGDYPTFGWDTATLADRTAPIYSSNSNGDMIGWTVSGLEGATSELSYTWRATGPDTIEGPSGAGEGEWRIATGSDEERLTWKPGRYLISCDIEDGTGQSAHVEYYQDVGWRTDRFLVVGQIRPLHDFIYSAAQEANIKSDMVEDILNTGIFKFASLWTDSLNQQVRDLTNPISVRGIIPLWVTMNMPPPQRLASFPNSPSNAGYWIIQELFNANGDTVALGPTIDNADKIDLLAAESYRMLAEYQVKYLVSSGGGMIRDTVVSVGTPDSPGGLSRLSLNGPTKLTIPSWALTVINAVGAPVPNNGNQLLIQSVANTYSGTQRIDRAGGKISLYTSARVGWEASYVNYALFERDVPYIFNEIIFGLDGAGRDNQNSIRLSVNKRWNQNSVDTGLIYFNEIRIYRRDNGSSEYTQEQVYSIDGGANMLLAFLNSIPLGQFTFPNVHSYEPTPETQDTL